MTDAISPPKLLMGVVLRHPFASWVLAGGLAVFAYSLSGLQYDQKPIVFIGVLILSAPLNVVSETCNGVLPLGFVFIVSLVLAVLLDSALFRGLVFYRSLLSRLRAGSGR